MKHSPNGMLPNACCRIGQRSTLNWPTRHVELANAAAGVCTGTIIIDGQHLCKCDIITVLIANNEKEKGCFPLERQDIN